MSMDFNPQQRAAIEHQARHLLVLAGAGTGKTRTIIGRAAHLIESGTPAERIVIVTFTRRAAHEIRSRLSSTIGAGGARVVAGTFHYLCLRIMRARRRWFGYQDMTIMDRDDQLQLMKLVRGECVGGKSSTKATVPAAAQLLDYYSYARNTNQPASEYLRKFTDFEQSSVELLLDIFNAYKTRKQTNGYLDYDDILHRFAKVLHDDAHVRERVATQYDHVLVDEMQDTNPLQWLILESLAEHCNLFCVGDDAQSIYAFRGADFQNVHSFSDRLPQSEVVKLEQNYRSTQPILELANWVLAQSPLNYDKTLHSERAEGTRPQLVDFDTELDEAQWIVAAIQARKNEGNSWSDHMILCRTAYSARPVEARLIEQKVPYRFVGGIGLLQMAHVKDLLAVLRCAVNHRDELAWMRYLTLWPRIGEVTAARAVERLAREASAAEAAETLKEVFAQRKEVTELPATVLQHLTQPKLALKAAMKALEPVVKTKYERWESRRNDWQLISKLAANHASLQAFLETYTLDPMSATEATAGDNPQEGVVTLITVHSAKGTEAKVCFAAAVQPGNYPHSRSLADPDAIEEERRVLYVALTRACDELFVTRSLSRGYARASWNASTGTHYFLEGLPAGVVDWDAPGFGAAVHVDDDVIG